MRFTSLILLCYSLVSAAGADLRRAEELYGQTQYRASLELLVSAEKDGAALNLIGRNYFMLGDFKRATECFQKSAAAEPANSVYVHWLGRGYGRRAETSSFFSAPGFASKARQSFEKAVELDPKNQEALNDLFDFYLQAPGFLGGGFDKAEAIAGRVAELNPAEGHFAQAQIAEKRKQFDTAERQLRRAMELAPRQVGRVLDLAKFLYKEGRVHEGEAAFQRAEKIAPGSPRILFERANTYIRYKQNLDEAKVLLKRYLDSNLTPDDPPREKAQELLRQVTGA